MLPEEDCAVILVVILLKRKDKSVYSNNSPSQPNLTWFLKQSWQSLTILTRVQDSLQIKDQTEGSVWRNNVLPSWKDLEELFKKQIKPKYYFMFLLQKGALQVNWMPALNQPGRKPEGQEAVRWNLGQAGRKHQEETPAAAVEAKEWAEALRQIITGRA